jgi:hypothetical protein
MGEGSGWVGRSGGLGRERCEEEFKRWRVCSIEGFSEDGVEEGATKDTPEWSAGFDGIEWDRNSGCEMRFWPRSSSKKNKVSHRKK